MRAVQIRRRRMRNNSRKAVVADPRTTTRVATRGNDITVMMEWEITTMGKAQEG